MKKIFLASLMLVASACASAQAPINLITSVTVDVPSSPPGQYLESWAATFNVTALRSGLPSIRLNLPDGTTDNIILVHFEPRDGYVEADVDGDNLPDPVPIPDAPDSAFSWRWYGRSDSWVVALTLERGVLAGRITGAIDRYDIAPRGSGQTGLGLIDPYFWQLHQGDDSQKKTENFQLSAEDGVDSLMSSTTSWDHTCTAPLPSDRKIIDVLILYTPGVLGAYGSSLANAKAALRSALDDANQSLSNSGINRLRFWLRGIEAADVAAGYDGNPDVSEILEHFGGWQTTATSPHISWPGNAYVTAKRDLFEADIVALARVPPIGDNSCGKALVNSKRIEVSAVNQFRYEAGESFSDFSYLVFNPTCGADRLNLAHEFGHLLGMEHDRPNGPNSSYTMSCPWSFGYRQAGTTSNPKRFRTVMAYARPGNGTAPACLNSSQCPLIDAYSNPNMEYDGFGIYPIGSTIASPAIGVFYDPNPANNQPGAQAHDTLVRMGAVVENFRVRGSDLIFGDYFD